MWVELGYWRVRDGLENVLFLSNKEFEKKFHIKAEDPDPTNSLTSI